MSGQYNFSRLLNPDWSIQISRALAVCKVGADFENLPHVIGQSEKR